MTAAVVGLAVLASLAWFLPQRIPVLFVHGASGGPYRFVVRSPFRITVSYLHSVEQCLVTEEFDLGGGDFLLVGSMSGATGAGLPWDGPGFKNDDGVYHIDGGGLRFDRLVFGARPLTGHRLQVNGADSVYFCPPEAADVGLLVRLVVHRVPQWLTPLLSNTVNQRRAGP